VRKRPAPFPWVAGYAAIALLPLLAALAGDPFVSTRSWVTDVSVGFGFIAFGLLVLQFGLVSRFGPASQPFGSDALMQAHRGMGILVLAFVVVHPAVLADSGVGWSAWNPFGGAPALQTGAVAAWATIVIVVTSLARRRLHLRYEWWQVIHLTGAVVVIVAAVAHMTLLAGYTASTPVRLIVWAYAALVLALLARYRLYRPFQLARHPWTVAANDDLGGSTRLLRLRPAIGRTFRFQPGQFAWLLTGRTPLFSEQHPLSIASSAAARRDGDIEFAVKSLGDWSGTTVPALAPGRSVWVDGPFGAFTPDRVDGRGFVLIAGGIGIAPMRSMLHTLADRGDRRPIVLFYAASDWSRVVFREEIEALKGRLALEVIYVFERPEPGWTGERGFVTADMLRRHLPADWSGYDAFVCGPLPMMTALERILLAIGMPANRIHTERFQMV